MRISERCCALAGVFCKQLASLRHGTGVPLAEVYGSDGIGDGARHGAVVAFNLRRSSSQYVGFAEGSCPYEPVLSPPPTALASRRFPRRCKRLWAGFAAPWP